MAKKRRVQLRENGVLSPQRDENYEKPLSYFSLFQYSTALEKSSIVFAVFLAIISGCVPPIINVLYGEFCNLMIDRQFPTNEPSTETFLLPWFGGGRILQNASSAARREALLEDSQAWGWGCAFFTFLQFLFSMISVFLLSFMASRQVSRIRIMFFKSILCKDLAWFDTQMSGNFTGEASDILNKMETGIGAVIGIFTYLLVIIAFAVIIPLIYGWKLTLTIIFPIPISFGTSIVMAKVIQDIQVYLIALCCCFLQTVSAMHGRRFDRLFFMSYYCLLNLLSLVSGNIFLIQKGIADVLSVYTFQLVVGILNVLISFLAGWLLALILLMFIIPVFISTLYKMKVQSKFAAKELALFTSAGNIAKEVFTHIRTVVAFEGENKEVERYSKEIEKSKLYGIKRGVVSGIHNGFSWFIIYCSYAVAFIFGVRFIESSKKDDNDEYTPAVLLIVFFGIVTALTNIGFASVHIETFSVACGAAASVFNVINTKSEINPCSEEGETSKDCKGEIEFRNVHFRYPSRPDVKILKGLNLKIKAGEIVAIIGGSGTGKSTILELVQRLYDPSEGEILLDGNNVKSIRVSWLRQQIGVVGQEPSLFSTTVRDNILYGNISATQEDVEEAAKKANAHDFIMQLKEGYNTLVGQKGSTLSGGQKQRIAIARALIRNPKILLLDEATSALDAFNEKVVGAALDKASIGRTTLIVTHRLSTITNANRIIVLDEGRVVEDGTHNELVAANGIYKQFLTRANNIKEIKRSNVGVSTSPAIYEDIPIMPSRPRSRFNSVGSHSRISKTQLLDKIQQSKVSCLKIIKWSKPEWGFLIVGSLASIIGGAALPIVCVLFGDLFGLLSLTDFNYVIKKTDIYTIILIIVGILAGICVFLQMYCFAKAGLKLTSRLRIKAFNCMIHQEMGYFDDEENKVGALCLRLSQDASGVQATVGIRLGVLMQAFSTMTTGIIFSFFFHWKITLVTLASVPFVFVGVYLESVLFESLTSLENKSVENASKIAVEVISLIKIVASLSKESFFLEKYSEAIKEGRKSNFKKSWLRGFAFAIGQTAPFFGYAVSLWYGGLLIANENLHYKYVITVSELLIFGAWTLGQSIVLGPSFAETKAAANRLNYIFSRKPRVVDGKYAVPPSLKKDDFITYSEVHFTYPTRPETKVLEDFSMTIQENESVVIMGASGSGKSTIIQLLLRFYDPTFGSISINKISTKEYKLSSLRKRLGLVSQEPVLFDRTIKENIAYGDNSREVSFNEITEAAKAANIHSFIASLPLGYDTNLGALGTQLSGGQKQRIAIARVLVRNPEILLLDEATSALDPESERVVQEALDKASKKRTTVTIAHRLGAVKNADVIYVMEKGKIKEFGTHEKLMNLRGIYYSMHYKNDRNNERHRPTTSEK